MKNLRAIVRGTVLLLLLGWTGASSGSLNVTVSVQAANELMVSSIRLGNSSIRPSETDVAILAFRIDNGYADVRMITGITVRDAFRGPGTAAELLSNVDSISLYLDMDDDSLLSAPDSQLVRQPMSSSTIAMSLSSLSIAPSEGKTFLVALSSNMYPRDGDSLDIYLDAAVDLTADIPVTWNGPPTVNSLGYAFVDGMISSQIGAPTTGRVSIQGQDTLFNVMSIDLPGNGA